MAKGFLYLVVVMDWVSRAVLAWRLCNTLSAEFCIEVIEAGARRIRTTGPVLPKALPSAHRRRRHDKRNHLRPSRDGHGS